MGIRDEILKKFDFDKQDAVPGTDKEELKALLEEGVREEIPEALEAVGYSCYGGNSIYPPDWKKSRDCLLRLIEISEDPSPFLYNTLGYIYYYGRANDYIPEYEKAFQYFTIGAVHHIHESQYKLADMLMGGKGVPKNISGAANLIADVYDGTLEYIEKHHFECKFADAALRLGELYEKGLGFEQDDTAALIMYLQADFAICKRMETADYYGDRKVASRIQEGLDRIREKFPPDYFRDRIETAQPYLIGQLLASAAGVDICFIRKDDAVYIAAKRLQDIEDTEERAYLFTIPEMNLCELTDSVLMRIDGLEAIDFQNFDSHAEITNIVLNEADGYWYFMNNGNEVFRFKCKGFTFER